MIRNRFLRAFLAIERFAELRIALVEESRKEVGALVGTGAVIIAVSIAILPAVARFAILPIRSLDIATVLVGLAACLSVTFRVAKRIPFFSVSNWRRSLRLTHTAFAAGCLPVVVLLILFPESLWTYCTTNSRESSSVTAGNQVLFVLQVAVWAGLTEEFIYRGLLMSVLRRWRAIASQSRRDLFALSTSSLLFGLVHLSTWGPVMSIALVGLGFGLGSAYLAIGELILPVVVYHITFDALSLSFALLSYRL